MEITYKTKSSPSRSTIKACDKSRKAFQETLIKTAKIINPYLVPIIWVITRFYKRKIGKNYIKYNFYLIK